MFRIYDNEKMEWVKEDVYLNSNGELFLIRQSLFGMIKTPLMLSQHRYVFNKAIDLYDKNNLQIFEGAYICARVEENKTVIGLVVFAQELSAYIILCDETNEFFTLGSQVCDRIEVIGNVFDGYEVDIEETEEDSEEVESNE